MKDNISKIKELEEKLAKYREILAQKKKVFRGVKHENSLSELRYTEYMVYREMVDGLQRELAALTKK